MFVRIQSFSSSGRSSEMLVALAASYPGLQVDAKPLGVSLGDALAATFSATGVLLALYSRDGIRATGRGQVVDVAIYERLPDR